VEVNVSRAGASTAVKPMIYVPIASVSMNGQNIMLNLLSGTQLPLEQVTTIR